jgi:hypothetical protein
MHTPFDPNRPPRPLRSFASAHSNHDHLIRGRWWHVNTGLGAGDQEELGIATGIIIKRYNKTRNFYVLPIDRF